MSGHGHSHGAGGTCEHESQDKGTEFNLYLKIDKANLECLNEAVDGSGKIVFKPWDQRMEKDSFVESDADEELIFKIPFTGCVKLKSIIVIGGEEDSHPSEMKLYKDRPAMSFDNVPPEPDQLIELHPDTDGSLEYSVKVVKFSSIQHLSIYFTKNFGAAETKVYYIGLRGDYTEAHRHGVTIVNYEARANPADHKTSDTTFANQQIS